MERSRRARNKSVAWKRRSHRPKAGRKWKVINAFNIVEQVEQIEVGERGFAGTDSRRAAATTGNSKTRQRKPCDRSNAAEQAASSGRTTRTNGRTLAKSTRSKAGIAMTDDPSTVFRDQNERGKFTSVLVSFIFGSFDGDSRCTDAECHRIGTGRNPSRAVEAMAPRHSTPSGQFVIEGFQPGGERGISKSFERPRTQANAPVRVSRRGCGRLQAKIRHELRVVRCKRGPETRRRVSIWFLDTIWQHLGGIVSSAIPVGVMVQDRTRGQRENAVENPASAEQVASKRVASLGRSVHSAETAFRHFAGPRCRTLIRPSTTPGSANLREQQSELEEQIGGGIGADKTGSATSRTVWRPTRCSGRKTKPVSQQLEELEEFCPAGGRCGITKNHSTRKQQRCVPRVRSVRADRC